MCGPSNFIRDSRSQLLYNRGREDGDSTSLQDATVELPSGQELVFAPEAYQDIDIETAYGEMEVSGGEDNRVGHSAGQGEGEVTRQENYTSTLRAWDIEVQGSAVNNGDSRLGLEELSSSATERRPTMVQHVVANKPYLEGQEDRIKSSSRSGIGRNDGVWNINQLPDESICCIFQWLTHPRDRSAVAMVCMRWLMLQSHMRIAEMSLQPVGESLEEMEMHEQRELEARIQIESNNAAKAPFLMVGDLSRSLEGRRATDVHLAAIAVGLQGRGGLGKLGVKGSLITSSSHITNVGLSAIGICCRSLRSVALWGCALVDDEGLAAIGEGCPLLEKVDLYKCPVISDKGMMAVIEGCLSLACLSIDNCQSVGAPSLRALGTWSKKLVSLTVADIGVLDSASVAAMAEGCQALKKMKLSSMAMEPECLHSLTQRCVGLERLKLCRLRGVGEAGMHALGCGGSSQQQQQGLASLKALWISHISGVTDQVLEAVGRACPSLQVLSLTACDDLTDEGIKAFLRVAVELEALNLGACSRLSSGAVKVILANAAGSGRKLRSLWLNECQGVCDRGVASRELLVSAGSSLRNIHLTRSSGVGNGCLAAIARCCPRLEELDLTGLSTVRDRGLVAIADGCRESLRVLNLTGCNHVTDHGLLAIAKHCGHTLQVLTLDGCCKVTDRGLRGLAEWCTVLRDVDVSKASITNEGLIVLLNACGSLIRSLSLAGCSGITDKCLPVIAAACKSLWALNLKNCPGLSRKAVGRLESRSWGKKATSELSCLFLDS